MLVRRDIFDRLSGFDTGYRGIDCEVDLCVRIRASRGQVWFEPTSVIQCYGQTLERETHDSRGVPNPLAEGLTQRVSVDEDMLAFDDGFFVTSKMPGRAGTPPWERILDDASRTICQRVADTQRHLLQKRLAQARELLLNPDLWPAHPDILLWASQVCLTLRLGVQSDAFGKRANETAAHLSEQQPGQAAA